MINTTIQYIVYTHTGGGVRHHHFGTQNNIINEADGHASPGDTINTLGFATLPFNGDNLSFAFMSVHGAADGNHLYTNPGNQTVPVGTTDIAILVVYAPPGGIGSGGGPGIWVDAFNVDTGDFSDSLDFITILTPPTPPDTIDGAKTTFANQEGEVSTVAAENIRANTVLDGVPFLEWKKITPTNLVTNTPEIDLTQNESGEIWFAFYQKLPSGLSIGRVVREVEGGLILWVGDDYCGNGGIHIPGHGPAPFRLVIDKNTQAKLGPAQQKQLNALIKEYPAIANSALTAMTKVLTTLKAVGTILSGARGQ